MILLLDNRDSFVWNLAQAFMALGQEVEVGRSDTMSARSVAEKKPDALVLSPGPGRPEQAGCCIEAVRQLSGQLPILGVCLGHQAIAAAFGAQITTCPPCHGKGSVIHHDQQGLFTGQASPLTGCRYHSLAVQSPLPPPLHVDAWTQAGLVMALSHETHPTFGLQFHPESFRSPTGLDLLKRFVRSIKS